MDRRSFLAAAGAGAGLGLAAPAIAQDKIVARLVTTWPRNFPGLGVGAQRVADRITAASGGRIEVKLFAAEELTAPFDSFDAVAKGEAEMYHGAEYYWRAKHPGFDFFASAPMGFTAQELQAWMRFGGGQALWDELSAGFGIKAMLAGNTGVQFGGWYRAPITSVDDFRGLRVRMPGLGGEVLRALGAEIVALPGGEILPALQDGRIDAAEWVGPYNDMALGIHNLLKVAMTPGFHEPGTGLSLGVNLDWWSSLSAGDKAMIEACAAAENDAMLAEFTARNGEALQRLVAEHGVQVARFPDEVFAALARLSEEIVAAAGNSDALAARILESYRTFRTGVARFTQISEQAYVDARARALGL